MQNRPYTVIDSTLQFVRMKLTCLFEAQFETQFKIDLCETYVLNKMEKQSKSKRHSYAREFKLKVSDWYMNNGKNIARTAQMFGVDRKQVRTCLKNEEIIQQQNHSNKGSGRGCTAKYPIMEDALYAEYKEARAKGTFLKRCWFNTRTKQLLKDNYPGKELK